MTDNLNNSVTCTTAQLFELNGKIIFMNFPDVSCYHSKEAAFQSVLLLSLINTCVYKYNVFRSQECIKELKMHRLSDSLA
jgi:hypothetical protein